MWWPMGGLEISAFAVLFFWLAAVTSWHAIERQRTAPASLVAQFNALKRNADAALASMESVELRLTSNETVRNTSLEAVLQQVDDLCQQRQRIHCQCGW